MLRNLAPGHAGMHWGGGWELFSEQLVASNKKHLNQKASLPRPRDLGRYCGILSQK